MKNKTEPINIVLASDQNYYIGLWVTLVSLLSNTKTKSVINFFIFDGGINKKSKIKLLKKLKEINKNISISYLEPQLGTFKNFNVPNDKPSGSLIYSSVIVPESLNNLDKAIYLDVDLLILMDIELLWNTKMDGKPIAAVIDYWPDYTTYNDIQNPSKYSIDLNSSYYNTGVLLYDIKALNQFNFTKKCINYLNNEDKKNYTSAIHNAVDKITDGNKGVIVTIVGTHNCVSCRGVKHQGAAMVTTKASGVFRDNDSLARKEFFDSLKINNGGHNI